MQKRYIPNNDTMTAVTLFLHLNHKLSKFNKGFPLQIWHFCLHLHSVLTHTNYFYLEFTHFFYHNYNITVTDKVQCVRAPPRKMHNCSLWAIEPADLRTIPGGMAPFLWFWRWTIFSPGRVD
jgi:hypothetical protein